jgi:hypothetical protein
MNAPRYLLPGIVGLACAGLTNATGAAEFRTTAPVPIVSEILAVHVDADVPIVAAICEDVLATELGLRRLKSVSRAALVSEQLLRMGVGIQEIPDRVRVAEGVGATTILAVNLLLDSDQSSRISEEGQTELLSTSFVVRHASASLTEVATRTQVWTGYGDFDASIPDACRAVVAAIADEAPD